jgi:protein gp37
MGKGSGIAWTNHTFNPWWGCVEVSPACDNCYAREWDARFAKGDAHWGKDQPRKFFTDKHWNEPKKWNKEALASGKRTLVFCASMADVFESGRPELDEHRHRLWELIVETPALTWLLLTKRPQNIKKLLPMALVGVDNIWLGTTIESPSYLWRADALCENRQAAVRFVSMEPLIENTSIITKLSKMVSSNPVEAFAIDWVITGCESGKNARDTPIDWYRTLRAECMFTGTPFFLKQAPRGADGITSGEGSWVKLKDGIIEQPYLDGKQHIGFPP